MTIAPHVRNGRSPALELVRALQRENEQLQEALQTRIVIEQAKGAISARFDLDPDDAFELMRGLSRSQNRRLHEYAAEAVANRGLLDPGVTRPSRQRALPRQETVSRGR